MVPGCGKPQINRYILSLCSISRIVVMLPILEYGFRIAGPILRGLTSDIAILLLVPLLLTGWFLLVCKLLLTRRLLFLTMLLSMWFTVWLRRWLLLVVIPVANRLLQILLPQ